MEFDAPHTPSFFSAALAADNNQNVFDQSFGAMVAAAVQPSRRDQSAASAMPHMGNAAMFSQPAAQFMQQNSSNHFPSFSHEPVYSKATNNMRQQAIDPRIIKPDSQFMPGHATMNHRQITPAASTESNTPEVANGNFNMFTPPQRSTESLPQQPSEPLRQLKIEEHKEQDEQAPPKPPKSRKGRKRLNLTEEAANSRRDRLLERNRVAASKCRDKKKEWTSSLESQARELQASKDSLSQLSNSLKDELLFLKTEMLKHTDCGCNQIRDYLKSQAEILTHSDFSHRPTSMMESPSGSLAATSPAMSLSNDHFGMES